MKVWNAGQRAQRTNNIRRIDTLESYIKELENYIDELENRLARQRITVSFNAEQFRDLRKLGWSILNEFRTHRTTAVEEEEEGLDGFLGGETLVVDKPIGKGRPHR